MGHSRIDITQLMKDYLDQLRGDDNKQTIQ